MSVYKEKETNKWYCKFYYNSWDGKKRQTTKRGFKTKREAQQWEIEFKAVKQADMSLKLESFVEMYFSDKAGELKERSIHNKSYMISKHVIPYFGKKKMNEITPSDIIQWQNCMREKGLSETYLRMIQNQISALFNHASRIYGLRSNPCSRVKKMGKSDADELNFWTRKLPVYFK